MPVPVKSTTPYGNSLSRKSQSTRSCGDRFIRDVDPEGFGGAPAHPRIVHFGSSAPDSARRLSFRSAMIFS